METWTIDPNKIEEKINERTKAIIPVHLYGMPCDMGKIIEIAKKHNLYVIEDCAEAHGAEYKNKKVGSLGDIGCFSFFGNKIITTGEGGMCVTNNKELKEKIKKLRNQGADEKNKYWHDIVGYNYKLTNIQAAIGLAQLRKINYFLECKKENAELYSTFLNDVPEIKMIQKKEDRKNVHWMNIILSNKKNEIMLALEKENIETRPFFIPINKMPPYYSSESYPIAEEMNKKGINLPSSTKLKKEEIKKICDIIKKVMKNEV
jgi:perosamine synthetase